MAANKFATMLHRNTNKPTLVLVYALLEWILILLLLLNSLFSYLIFKFSDYFGLKRPCLCCSRIEHIIEPKNYMNKSCFRDLVCESHASEISKLGFCYNHRKLAESEDMCDDCLSSSSSSSESDCVKISKNVKVQDTDGLKALKCSCCGAHLGHTQMQNLITQGGIEVDGAEINGEGDCTRSDSALFDHQEDEDQEAKETMEAHNKVINGEIPRQHLEFFIHGDNRNLIPFELIESSSLASERQSRYMVAEETEPDDGNEDVILDFDMLFGGAEIEPVFENWHTSGDSVIDFTCRKRKPKSPPVTLSLVEENLEQNLEEKPRNHNLEVHVESREGLEEETEMEGDEFETEVSIGTEIPDHEQVDEYHIHDINVQEDSSQHMQEDDPSSSSMRFLHVQIESGDNKDEEEFVEFQTMKVETRMPKVLRNQLESTLDSNENEEEAEKIPDTPTSVERKESGTEESFDGSSTISDIEPGELTVEKLKSALKAERNALSSVYAELEEERSASAVAANQTMAMINRLQEEKAAMKMEALQYQRMMEEQSEYDQEALQLLNDLMVKREKEKQELEREVETFRKKVQEFEVNEKPIMSNSSVSCSNEEEEEDSDGLSLDLDREAKKENGCYSEQNTNTPVDVVIYLEESLANFEEERLSILEQLKILEKKLAMLNHKEEEDKDKDVCNHHENGNGCYNYVNGFGNGNSQINGSGRKKISKKRIESSKWRCGMNQKLDYSAQLCTNHDPAKSIDRLIQQDDGYGSRNRLLPIFEDEIGKEENDMDLDLENISSMEENSELEEELDDVYERLQALEADREFLKHCISSMKKGDKGLYLLQEILHYLHDLRNVDFRVKNIADLAV